MRHFPGYSSFGFPLVTISPMYTALTIGVSDSSGGAGVQADLKVFTVLGVYGMAVVTAVVARNTNGARGVQSVDQEIVAKQIEAIAEDLPVGGAQDRGSSVRRR